MCGIVGRCTPADATISSNEVLRSLAAIRHRGPDADGAWTGRGIGLGHARLSILDLSSRAAQPMVSGDGRYVLAFNGEIYNFRELREDLAAERIAVSSTGDTEVLLAHVARFGVTATLPKLEGDWAAAVWDTREDLLTLARDVHGVKPLYYVRTEDGGLRFGSEHKALIEPGSAAAAPSMAAVNAALLGYSVTWGDRTLYRGVHAVRPGEQVIFGRRSGTIDRRTFASVLDWVDEDFYRELRAAPASEVLALVEHAITAGVRSRLISDAPVACFVSGGVDSSLIATLAAEEYPDLPLYHADVVNDTERPAAQALAQALDRPLRTVPVTDQDVIAAIPEVTWYNDGPLIYHLNSLPFYAICELAAADGIKVLLTGEGSDEYFIGYPQDALQPVIDLVRRAKRVPRRWLSALSPKAAALFWPQPEDSYGHRLVQLSTAFEDEQTVRHGRATSNGVSSRRDRRSRIASLSRAQSHLMSLLHRNDRLGMAWGLEARFPFLHPELTKLAINLPDRYKLRRVLRPHDRRHPFIVDKWAVREIAGRRMPAPLAARPKRGFPVSIGQRLNVPPRFFTDGFLADTYDLDQAALALAVGDGPSGWLTRLVLLEVWGQIFFYGESLEAMRDRLLAHADTAS